MYSAKIICPFLLCVFLVLRQGRLDGHGRVQRCVQSTHNDRSIVELLGRLCSRAEWWVLRPSLNRSTRSVDRLLVGHNR